MKYQMLKKTSGAWVNKAEIKSGVKCKIVSETTTQPSNFKNPDGTAQTQDVCKVMFQGAKESVNVALNKPTMGALIEAFGDESIDWQNKPLTAETEKVRVSGRAGYALYIIPEGFERVDDENGYCVIIKKGTKANEIPVINEEGINVSDIPF